MTELRTDWLTGRTVLVAENRALRPNEFGEGSGTGEMASVAGLVAVTTKSNCPFCAGNESSTPPAVYQVLDERGQWRVRVVPNMFPAVECEPPAGVPNPAHGSHEVIVESARHISRMSALSTAEIADALVAYAERLRHWRESGHFRYALVFKNQGPKAGASLAHVHSQLVTLSAVPPAVEREIERAEADFARHGECAYCRQLAAERQGRERIILDRDGFIAFCPYASLQPLEVWLQPVAHEPSFELTDWSGGRSQRLAEILTALFARLETAAPEMAFNLLLRTAPWLPDVERHFHWRIEILPRFNALAGLELATGVHINPLPPEKAAARLRLL